MLSSTGFVPNKTLALGRRTVVAFIRETLLTSLDFAVCGMDGVTLNRDSVTRGNVGSNQNISLTGPAGNRARTEAYAGQPGDATAGGTVTCSGSCGAPEFQVAGTTTSNYPSGQVCPVLPVVTCTPGTTDFTGGSGSSLTVSAASGTTSLRDVTLGSSSTLAFETVSPTEVLTVQMRTLLIGQNSRVRVNAVILAPNGRVQLDQSALSNGAIQSLTVQFDQNTNFSYNNTNLAIGSGVFNTLTSWREQP